MKKIDFIEKSNAHVAFEHRLTNAALGSIVGGERIDEPEQNCNPWSDCDAWNCHPDCICKSNLA